MKLRKSAIKEISEQTGVTINKKSDVEQIDNLVLVDKTPYFFLHEKRLIPTLALKNLSNWPVIILDEGAAKFIIKGADVMRPGIIHIDQFGQEDILFIKESTGTSVIAVGKALFDSKTIQSMDKGKVILTLHYVGDELWKKIKIFPR